jgi:hypothetical protein
MIEKERALNRSELLEKIRAGRSQLESALAQLSEEQMAVPALENNWSGKDLLAHFGWWAQRIVGIYPILTRGETPASIGDNLSMDATNAKVFNDYHDRPLAEVRQMEHEAYLALLSLAESAPEDDLFNAHRFAWTNGAPFVNWLIGDSYGHYEEHIEALKRWVQIKDQVVG